MAKELLHGPKSLYITSDNGTVEYFNEGARITGRAWVNQHYPQSFGTDYIEIDPNKTFYYDILYSSPVAGNQYYIGFERFDANKTATSNSSTTYVISGNTIYEDRRVTGTVSLSTNLSGNPTKYIRLRILNQWTGSSAATGTGILEIKNLSLLQLDADEKNPSIEKTGIASAANFRENNINAAMIFKKEGFEVDTLYEI